MRHVLLLRGINLGARRRVPMADLRALLEEAGYEGVGTLLQSGNIVLTSGERPQALAAATAALISGRYGFEVAVVGRSRDELAAVVAADPLRDVADDPKLYQVSFLDAPLRPEVIDRLQALRTGAEVLAVAGREIFTWHPEGVARSKLMNCLTGNGLGVTATARNWRTVTALLSMADA